MHLFATFISWIHRTFRAVEAEAHGGRPVADWLLNILAAAVLIGVGQRNAMRSCWY